MNIFKLTTLFLVLTTGIFVNGVNVQIRVKNTLTRGTAVELWRIGKQGKEWLRDIMLNPGQEKIVDLDSRFVWYLNDYLINLGQQNYSVSEIQNDILPR